MSHGQLHWKVSLLDIISIPQWKVFNYPWTLNIWSSVPVLINLWKRWFYLQSFGAWLLVFSFVKVWPVSRYHLTYNGWNWMSWSSHQFPAKIGKTDMQKVEKKLLKFWQLMWAWFLGAEINRYMEYLQDSENWSFHDVLMELKVTCRMIIQWNSWISKSSVGWSSRNKARHTYRAIAPEW